MTDGIDRSNEATKGEGSGLRPPPGMHPAIARIIEALARDAVRMEDLRAAELAAAASNKPQTDDK